MMCQTISRAINNTKFCTLIRIEKNSENESPLWYKAGTAANRKDATMTDRSINLSIVRSICRRTLLMVCTDPFPKDECLMQTELGGYLRCLQLSSVRQRHQECIVKRSAELHGGRESTEINCFAKADCHGSGKPAASSGRLDGADNQSVASGNTGVHA